MTEFLTNEASVETAKTIDHVISTRTTQKVLSAGPLYPLDSQSDAISVADKMVRDSVAMAGWAPFHYDRNLDGIAEPWRIQLMFHRSCRALAKDFANLAPDVKPGSKIPGMLNACGALVLVHCLPQENLENPSKLDQVNREHHAAASAAAQNLLLALHARGLGTYWSSGGPLGSREVHERCGIGPGQSLVAAVFVDYPFLSETADVTRFTGKNRTRRSAPEKWSTEILLEG